MPEAARRAIHCGRDWAAACWKSLERLVPDRRRHCNLGGDLPRPTRPREMVTSPGTAGGSISLALNACSLGRS